MPRFEIKLHVDATEDRVFSFVRPSRFPEWRPAIKEVKPLNGTLDRPGAAFVTDYGSRIMPGSRHEIVAIDPPRLLELQGEAEGARYRARFRLRSAGVGTDVTFENEYEAVGLIGRLLHARIARSLEQEWSGDLQRLKRLAEAHR